MTGEDELRRRLEDAAGLLDATRLRLRALVPALEAWRWKSRVRALTDLAREVARSDEASRAALARALRRADAEAWPPGETRALLDEVQALLHRFDGALVGRGFPDVATLLRSLIGVRRAVALTARDDAAAEVLHPDEPELQVLARFGPALEALFSRPVARAQRIPFTLAELDGLLAQWAEGARALAGAWRHVAAIDTTGGVERTLRRRARLAPKSTRGHLGPRLLVAADFWLTSAEARLAELVAERFAPVHPRADERTACLRFLISREVDGAARLGESPREALLMLAHELTAGPEGRAPLVGGQGQVLRWAEAADALEGDDDWRRLRDGLRALTLRSSGPSLPPLYRVGAPKRLTPPLPERLRDFFPGARQT